MSIRVMSLVWEYSKQQGSALLVLLAIADFADDDGYCYPSVERLAHKARMSVRNVRYVLRQIEESGELVIEPGGGRRRPNRYRVMVQPAEGETRQQVSVKDFQGKSFTETQRQESAETLQPVAAEPSLRTVTTNSLLTSSGEGSAKSSKKRSKPEPVPRPEALDTAAVLIEAPWVNADEEAVAKAVERSFTIVRDFDPRDGPYLAEKYIRYRGYHKKAPSDWYRAWLTWLRKEVNFGPSNQTATHRPSGTTPARGQGARPAGLQDDYDAFVGIAPRANTA